MQARRASERDFDDWGLLADIAGELMQVFFAGKLYLATSSKNFSSPQIFCLCGVPAVPPPLDASVCAL